MPPFVAMLEGALTHAVPTRASTLKYSVTAVVYVMVAVVPENTGAGATAAYVPPEVAD